MTRLDLWGWYLWQDLSKAHHMQWESPDSMDLTTRLYCLFNLGIKSSSRLLFSDLVWRTLIGWWYLTLWTVVAGPWCCYLAMWLEASSHTTIGSHDCDEAASLFACGNLYMEVGAKPLEVGARYRKLARLAQWGILSHFLRNLVQQVSRIWKVICGQSCQQQTNS